MGCFLSSSISDGDTFYYTVPDLAVDRCGHCDGKTTKKGFIFINFGVGMKFQFSCTVTTPHD